MDKINTVKMGEIGQKVGLPERLFLTREKADEAYLYFRQILLNLSDGQELILEFPDNQIVDASFADGTIVRLLEELVNHEYGDRGLLVKNLSNDSLFNLDTVLKMSRHRVAVIALTHDGSWNVVGKIEPVLLETLQLLVKNGSLTAPQLVGLCGLAINNASNRLKRLYDQRLVRRDFQIIADKGLVYTYRSWTSLVSQNG